MKRQMVVIVEPNREQAIERAAKETIAVGLVGILFVSIVGLAALILK